MLFPRERSVFIKFQNKGTIRILQKLSSLLELITYATNKFILILKPYVYLTIKAYRITSVNLRRNKLYPIKNSRPHTKIRNLLF